MQIVEKVQLDESGTGPCLFSSQVMAVTKELQFITAIVFDIVFYGEDLVLFYKWK